jgi:putative phosphoribosyl transferase
VTVSPDISGRFANRHEAGRLLADAVAAIAPDDCVVLALPRGGVPVAFEVAKKLHAPLDILLVRKIGAPGHEEYGIGALVDGDDPQVIIDDDSARRAGASADYIDGEIQRQLREVERRRAAYARPAPVSIGGRTVILVDDGIATGSTVRVALQALRRSNVEQIILAVPVAPRSTLSDLSKLCDRMVCLMSPTPFHSVGAHYADFTQTDDDEVITLLKEAEETR